MLDFLNTYIFGSALPFVVFFIGGILLFKYGSFIFFKVRVIIGVLTRKNDSSGFSPFKTAVLALASTLGVGNIVGVSTAIFSGGPGAVFWLTLSAFVAMSLKYGEVVLAMKYRVKEGGEYRGGAMYYMRDFLKKPRLSVLFAFLCIINSLTVGNIVQINAVSESFFNVFNIPPWILGAFLALLILISIYRGTERISNITSKVIPIVTLVYIILSLYVILINFNALPKIIKLILDEAFNLKAAAGGIAGYSMTHAVRYGVARGIMSNEAGSGTSPIAHVKSNLKSPAEQGFWGIFEVFADTVVMCNLTAFVILLTFEENVVNKGLTGMALVLESYGKYAGSVSKFILTMSVFLFAYATVICQAFYGSECLHYLSKNKLLKKFFIIAFCLTAFFGAVGNSNLIWQITDLNISLMTVINTFCIFFSAGEIKKITDGYFNNK